MYARGMTMREIQAFLLESYGVEVSPEFISSVTEAVMAEVTAWQNRPLELMYPVVFFDALRARIKDEGGGAQQGDLLGLSACWPTAPATSFGFGSKRLKARNSG
jgi:putative transposase